MTSPIDRQEEHFDPMGRRGAPPTQLPQRQMRFFLSFFFFFFSLFFFFFFFFFTAELMLLTSKPLLLLFFFVPSFCFGFRLHSSAFLFVHVQKKKKKRNPHLVFCLAIFYCCCSFIISSDGFELLCAFLRQRDSDSDDVSNRLDNRKGEEEKTRRRR